MNLKEAFRYQNRLQNHMQTAEYILREEENLVQVRTTYLRHKVMREAEDETILEAAKSEYYDRITQVAQFTVWLLKEKERLCEAVRKAKDGLDIDMDSQVGLNTARQRIAQTFRSMNEHRSSERIVQNGGTGHRFNAEGNQVTYRCDAKKVTTINFDRNVIRRELARLDREADEMSARLDLCLVTSKVEYEPPFDVNASFTEAFETWADTRA